MRVNRKLACGIFFGMAALIFAFAPIPAAPQASHKTRTFLVEASQFAYSPEELSVNPGDTVVIQLVSMDVVHGLYIDDYNLSVEADPGQTQTLTFTANKPGSFRIRCNVTCGAMHPFMIGKLNVGVNTSLVRAAGLSLLAVLGLTVFARRDTGL